MKKILFLFIILILVCLPIGRVLAEQIDINTATLSQLDEIVHVGAKTAQKIIDDRPYSSIQDLSRVKGIGDGKYLQDIISQGFACVNCAASPAATTSQANLATPTPQTPATAPITATNEQEKMVTPTTYPTGVIINELLPNPSGPDETDEWIEIFNSNSIDIDLSGWQLQDKAGTITTYSIPQGTKILANNFLVFKRPTTQIMLNNDEDGLNLLTPDGKIIDSTNFTSAPLSQSYNKTLSGLWQWSTTLTPGAKNIITALAKPVATTKAPSTSSRPNDLSKTKNSVKNDGVDINQDNKIENPWFLFFTVLSATIILAIIVLLIKFKLNKHVRT